VSVSTRALPAPSVTVPPVGYRPPRLSPQPCRWLLTAASLEQGAQTRPPRRALPLGQRGEQLVRDALLDAPSVAERGTACPGQAGWPATVARSSAYRKV